jgi:quercetin dioxygenase-like cupin family protein
MRRVAIIGLLAFGTIGAVVAAQALATTGSGAVSTYVARGPVSQSVVIGVPRTATATKSIRVRVGRKVVTRRVKFTYATVAPLMTCGESTTCDTAMQQLTIPPGGYTGWHSHPGPTFVAVAQGQGTLITGCPGAPRRNTTPAPGSCSLRLRFTT